MGSLATTNATLSGHKLLIVSPYYPPPDYIDRLKRTYTGLDVVYVNVKQNPSSTPSRQELNLPQSIFENVTVTCTYNIFPTPYEAPNLQYVQLSTSGINHLTKEPIFSNQSIRFCNTTGIHPPRIAEWVISTFLSLQHDLFHHHMSIATGTWNCGYINDFSDSIGLRIGILGYGAIGRQVAAIADVMGMDVFAFTLRPRVTLESRKDKNFRIKGPKGDPDGLIPKKWFHGSTKEDINHFLSQDLDIVVIALPLTPLTTGLFCKEQFRLMRSRRTFVSNIGRGPQIVTDDLVEALEQGWIRGAALDVTDPEPLPKEHALWKAKNCLITPHVSGFAKKNGERMLQVLEENLGRMAKGESLLNEVDRRAGY